MCISTPDIPPPPPPPAPPPPAPLPPQERVRAAAGAGPKTRAQLRRTGARSLRIPLMSGGSSGVNLPY